MKKILTLLFFLIATASIGQYPINQILSSDSTMVSVGRNATGGIRGGLVNMVFADTTAANLSRISYYTGAQIWTTTDSAIWVRFKGTPSFWVKMAGASGGTTGSFWNITGNYFGGGVPLNYGVGTNSYDYLPLKTNNITRLLIPPDGILRSSAPANKYLMMDTTTLEMYYGDGGGGSGWSLTGNTGIDTTNFIGTIDSVPFIIRTHNQFSGTVGSYITGYDNSVITTGNFPYRHGLISLGIGAAKSLPLNNTGGIVVIGTDALKNLHNSSVSNNYAANGLVVIGTNAYKYLDSSFYPYGNRSTVIGHWAGHRNFAGEYNTIVGAMNMELNYRGSNNTSIGFSTLRSNIDGGGNVAMGLFSMLYNSTGIDTIPLISGGSGYTYANVTISAPLAGSPGGYVQTATATADVSGGAVTAIRMTNKGAGYSIYPHTYDFGTQGNIVVTITGDGTGATAGTPVMISGNDNTCIGTGSGFYNIRGKGNVNVGNSSSNKTDDNYTTLVGFGTSTNSPSGKISKAGAIGYNAKVGASNSLVLGGTGADTVNVGIDVEKPLARLHIASGNIVAQGTTEAYPSTHYLPFSGIGARFMWVNSKRAIRAGYVTDNKWDIDSIAHGSVAFGYYTGAMGYGSLAQGEYAYARGKAALAVGWQVAANADFSVALGAGNNCYGSWSTSFGLNNIANSNISLATGYGTIAYDGASTFGNGTRGKGFYSFATGIGNYSKNYGGAAFGTYNDTTDVGSISAIDNANRIFVVGNGTADNARSNALTILQTGKVGIGTTSPDSLLTVSQGIYGQRGLRLPNLPTGKKAKQLYWDTDGTVYVADSTVGGGGGGGWSLTGNAGTNPASNFIGTTDGQPLMFRYNNQNAGSIGKEGMHTYLGIEAGENDVSGGDPNIGIGSYVLSSNTTGDGNSAVGGFALGSNTTGYYNSAVGVSALYSNTTGYYNSAVGVSAGDNAKQKVDAKNQILIGANTYGTRDSIAVIGANFMKETILRGKLIDSTLSAGVGTKAVRWNDATGEFTYADTTVGGGGSPAGSNRQVQYNNSGAFGGAAGVEIGNTNNRLLIQSQSTTELPLILKMAASQTAKIMSFQNSSGTELSYVDKDGNAYFNGIKMGKYGGEKGFEITTTNDMYFVTGGDELSFEPGGGTTKMRITYYPTYSQRTLVYGGNTLYEKYGTNLSFYPSSGNSGFGAGGTENLLYITTTGNVGIGTTSPTTKLNVSGTFAANQGSDVASANNLAVVANSTEITGTTQVNLIANTGWVNGSQITLLLASGITIKNGQTTSGSNITILLDGAADFVTSAASSLTLLLCEVGGTQAWREISRRSY